ncbi:ankyrin repeat domain-containing protein [Vibrio sp. SCSIO 43132]|uniref:ankyrin repeat domain-containing protein n=1 Tax=Vibrio sp. SCSIO 43132 TaxID=2779363 RepID=UPI001CA83557|nr:ankyrin repeat domain-containing protein [Vibrio sp. SCSIO 43132]UAB72988.1 ankyrin repeat domain-containing protein [Vibrio sp. SCSIO 43132]
MKNSRLFLLLFSPLMSLNSEAAGFSKSWFQPTLKVNNDPVCQTMLPKTKELWDGDIDRNFPSSLERNAGKEIKINGNTIYLTYFRHAGCGGACERYQYLASVQPFPNRRDDRDFYNELSERSPPIGEGHILSSDDGKYYLYVSGKEEDQLHQLLGDASWKHLCTLNKMPTTEQIKLIKSDYYEMQDTLLSLRGYVRGLRRQSGSASFCGSMATHGRWSIRISDEFKRLLHAPKQTPEKVNYNNYDDSTYEIDFRNLELWALQGLSEYEAFNSYVRKINSATVELTQFYQDHFHWGAVEAEKIANYALKSAISSGIRFYMYKPFETEEEIQLRRAILQKLPIDQIMKIDVSHMEKSSQKIGWYDTNESILNASVTYPRAIAYLLEKGFDPNNKNVFNKTPLMYAAQYDSYESTKLLIEAGAQVNTGTIIPDDRCQYTLRTSNMSPLHYAVRYASKDLIQLLLDNGASKNFGVRNERNHPATIEYPIDWLTKYVNDNLTDDDRKELTETLKLSSH